MTCYALASQIGHLYAIFDLLGLCDAYFYNVYFYAINMMINFVSLVFAWLMGPLLYHLKEVVFISIITGFWNGYKSLKVD